MQVLHTISRGGKGEERDGEMKMLSWDREEGEKSGSGLQLRIVSHSREAGKSE